MNSIRVASLKDNISRKVSLTTKIFVWSILFEPLIFFHIVPQNISGVGGSISRILQFIVLSIFIFRFLISGKARIYNPFSLLNRGFSYFYILAISAGILGYFFGSYSANLSVEFLEQARVTSSDNLIASLVQSPYFRPFFEYFIALYYFVYFVVVTQYMLTTKEALNYFFKSFNFVFLTCIIIGFADLLFLILFSEEYRGIPRYIADGIKIEGLRFHGIIGEPRDAFNFLVLSIGLLTLKDIFCQERKLTFIWIILILIACFFTYSFSGVLGVIFTIGLLIVFYLPTISFKKLLLSFFGLSIVLLLIFINVKYSPRLMLYVFAIRDVYQSLDSGGELSPVIANVMNNIYPVWHIWLEVKEFNFFHLFFGNGFGSASVINNYYLNELAVINPNSSLIRMIYENGIIGIILFVFVFLKPLKILCVDKKLLNKLVFLMLMMLGMYFAHRSASLYIFLGIAITVCKRKSIATFSSS